MESTAAVGGMCEGCAGSGFVGMTREGDPEPCPDCGRWLVLEEGRFVPLTRPQPHTPTDSKSAESETP